jgi:hypothetical protein
VSEPIWLDNNPPGAVPMPPPPDSSPPILGASSPLPPMPDFPPPVLSSAQEHNLPPMPTTPPPILGASSPLPPMPDFPPPSLSGSQEHNLPPMPTTPPPMLGASSPLPPMPDFPPPTLSSTQEQSLPPMPTTPPPFLENPSQFEIFENDFDDDFDDNFEDQGDFNLGVDMNAPAENQYRVSMCSGSNESSPNYLWTNGLADCVGVGFINDKGPEKDIQLYHSVSEHLPPPSDEFMRVSRNFMTNVEDPSQLSILINRGFMKQDANIATDDLDLGYIRTHLNDICREQGKAPIPDNNFINVQGSSSFYLTNQGEYGTLTSTNNFDRDHSQVIPSAEAAAKKNDLFEKIDNNALETSADINVQPLQSNVSLNTDRQADQESSQTRRFR